MYYKFRFANTITVIITEIRNNEYTYVKTLDCFKYLKIIIDKF